MKFFLRILVTGIVVVLLSQLLPGVTVDGYLTAVVVALVLALLNLVVRPILVLFTLPITILSLGLFLIVINAIIILLADAFIDGFDVAGFWIAVLFSLLLSLFQSIVFSLAEKD